MRRRKGRSDELLRALRYERALVYEDLGKPRRARAELEKLYAEDPDDEDVAARLGLQRKSASTPLRAETLHKFTNLWHSFECGGGPCKFRELDTASGGFTG